MQVNKSYSTPALARLRLQEPEKKKNFLGTMVSVGVGKRQVGKQEVDLVLGMSASTRALADAQIKRARGVTADVQKLAFSTAKKEAAERRKRDAIMLRLNSNRKKKQGHKKDYPLYKTVLYNTPPSGSKENDELVEKLVSSYTRETEDLWEQEGKWGEGKEFRISTEGRKELWEHGSGADKCYQGLNLYTDIASTAARNIAKWKNMPNRQGFDSSGPRIPPIKLGPQGNVDNIGMQIRLANHYWTGRNKGVKFHDVERDTMAFAKATIGTGSDLMYPQKSTLDKRQTYHYPFECTDERFPDPDPTPYKVKGSVYAPKHSGTQMASDDPDYYSSDDDDRTIIERTLPVHERSSVNDGFALSVIKAKLKGPSPSFKDNTIRTGEKGTEIYPDIGWNYSLLKEYKHWSRKDVFMKTGPSGREKPSVFKPRFSVVGEPTMKPSNLSFYRNELAMNSPILLNETAAKIYNDLQEEKRKKRKKKHEQASRQERKESSIVTTKEGGTIVSENNTKSHGATM